MMPASRGSAVVYSHLLASTGLPYPQAHAEFERALDARPAVPPELMSVEDKRAVLQAAIIGRGELPAAMAAGAFG